MPLDILFAQGNEDACVRAAQQLGFSAVCFAYPTLDALRDAPRVSSRLWLCRALFVSSPTPSEVQKLAQRAQSMGAFCLVQARDDAFNRFVLEKTAASVLVDPEQAHASDHLHFRRGGLDQVLCRIAAARGKAFARSLPALLTARNRPLLLGRALQNIRFCQRKHVPYGLVSFAETPAGMRGAHDLRSLSLILGMDAVQYHLFEPFFCASDKVPSTSTPLKGNEKLYK